MDGKWEKGFEREQKLYRINIKLCCRYSKQQQLASRQIEGGESGG
jgi:hypothetical protein